MKPSNLNGGADLSECGRYRYRLWRDWSEEATSCLFVMLNPSTADADTDDPTIRKCVGFAKRWGHGAVYVVNLFAFRSTSPRGLLGVADPVGNDNDAFLCAEAMRSGRIVFAWGSHAPVRHLVAHREFVLRSRLRRYELPIQCLGKAKDGNPRHPLMLAYDTPLVPYEAREARR